MSAAEPVTALRTIPIRECGEELIDFLAACPALLLDRPRFRYRRETLLRRTVAEMLCRAENALPAGYRLAVVEGWRPPHIQQRMYRTLWNTLAAQHPTWTAVKLRRVVNRYTAPLHGRVPPPHSTGGAVDVMLAREDGAQCDHCSPYDPFDPAAFSLRAAGLSAAAQETRSILADALTLGGLTNYPSEYWHWTYGDQGWAYRTGAAHAIYGAVTPPSYTPDPADVQDAPLERYDS